MAVAVLAGLVAVTAAVGAARPTGRNGNTVLSIDNGRCGSGISDLRTGRSTFTITNHAATAQEVTVYDSDHRYAYGEIEMIAPRVSRSLIMVLPAGTFSLACEGDDGTVGYSDPFTVTGPQVAGVHRWIPATYGDLANAVSRYRKSVTAGLNVLARDTDALQAALTGPGQDVTAHDRDVARKRWLVAHLDYERLGAAYGTFGDYADKIDGRPDGLPGGVHDPDFTGFHRLEYLLWHKSTTAQVRSSARTLDRDVRGLVAAFPGQITAPNDVALRTHEVLENSMQFELTGDTDQGSHSNLATVSANLDGTELTLAAMKPLLQQNDPALLSAAQTSLTTLRSTLDSYRRHGAWPSVQSLTARQRERLNGTLGQTLETLAAIPTELEILTTHDNG